MRKPKLPRFGVVGRHAHALLAPGVELVEKVRIHSRSCRDDKEACAGLAREIDILNAAQRNPAGRGMKCGPRRCGNVHGQAEIVRQRVRRPHGKYRQRDAGIRQLLENVVDGAVAAAREDGVTTRQHGLPRFLLGVVARVGEDELGLDVRVAEQREHGFQLCLAPHAPAAGIRVIEQGCLTHGGIEDGLYFEALDFV